MAKFKAEELKDVIGKCTRFSTTKGLIPEYGFLALREGYIFATDGRIGIKHRNPVSIPEEFILPAEIFSRLLSSQLFLKRKVDLARQENLTVFKAGRIRIKIPNPPHEYLINVDVPPDDSFHILPDGFSEAIKQVLFSVPKQERVKEALRGINYDGKSFYASDNIKLSRITPNFSIPLPELFIPTQLLEHLVEDKPISYCITESEGADRMLWFSFKDYVIFTNVKDSIYPMGEEIFDKLYKEKVNSAVISADPEELKNTVAVISILAELYMNRVNLVAFKNELTFYTLTPGGLEAIGTLPVTSNVKEGDRAELVAVDTIYLKEIVNECSDFFFTGDFAYFSNKDGLESVLKPLGVEDGVTVMEKVGEYYGSEDGTTGVDNDDSGGTGGGTESPQA
jgi:hypothetical protein